MKNMNNEQNVSLPPIRLDNYSDFKEISKGAAVIVFSPEYYLGPFTDEPRRLCRFTLTALGVRKNNVPLTFKFVNDDVRDIDAIAEEILVELENQGNLVRGTVETSRPMGELLVTWP
jgi:hypothetical protein